MSDLVVICCEKENSFALVLKYEIVLNELDNYIINNFWAVDFLTGFFTILILYNILYSQCLQTAHIHMWYDDMCT